MKKYSLIDSQTNEYYELVIFLVNSETYNMISVV